VNTIAKCVCVLGNRGRVSKQDITKPEVPRVTP